MAMCMGSPCLITRIPATSIPIGVREFSGIVEFPKFYDLATTDREDVHPIACHFPAGLADLPVIVAEDENVVVGGEEFLRRKHLRFLMLRDGREELLHLGLPLPGSK